MGTEDRPEKRPQMTSEEESGVRRGGEFFPTRRAGGDIESLDGCDWTTIHNLKRDKCVKITHNGGGPPENVPDIEIEIDGKLQDDTLKKGKSTKVEGKKIRIHAKGPKTSFVFYTTEDC